MMMLMMLMLLVLVLALMMPAGHACRRASKESCAGSSTLP